MRKYSFRFENFEVWKIAVEIGMVKPNNESKDLFYD